MAKVKEVPNVQELLAKAQKPSADAMKLHPFYRGKIETVPKGCIRSIDDFAIWYTPGVAAPCRAIQKDPELVYDYTNKWNTVAVISDGTRVLGLGDIGPKAGLPVMEGKALLFKWLGGVDAVPIMLDTKDPDEIIRTTLLLQPSFGGVNLEDLSQPKCFRILDTLREQAEIPMWHDDQQGTACVTVAGLLNALKIVGKPIDQVQVVFIGSGAANVAITRLCLKAGVDPAKCRVVDSQGILHDKRQDIYAAPVPSSWISGGCARSPTRRAGRVASPRRWSARMFASRSASRARAPSCPNGSAPWPRMLSSSCAPIRCPKSGRGRLRRRAHALWPPVAPTSRTRSITRWASPASSAARWMSARRTITDEMCIAAAEALAGAAPDGGMDPHCILPTMVEWEVYAREAVAVGMKAQEQGIARLSVAEDVLFRNAADIILRSRKLTEVMMETGLIQAPPAD